MCTVIERMHQGTNLHREPNGTVLPTHHQFDFEPECQHNCPWQRLVQTDSQTLPSKDNFQIWVVGNDCKSDAGVASDGWIFSYPCCRLPLLLSRTRTASASHNEDSDRWSRSRYEPFKSLLSLIHYQVLANRNLFLVHMPYSRIRHELQAGAIALYIWTLKTWWIWWDLAWNVIRQMDVYPLVGAFNKKRSPRPSHAASTE